jgi:signal transduction histidine kinase
VDALARVLFDLSPAGVILFRPVFDEQRVLSDFAYDQLNRTAQQLLSLPEQPTQTFRQLYPNTEPTGIFAFYRDTFLNDQPGYYGTEYSYDGLDAYYQLAAQRVGEQLVVTFTDAADRRQGDMAAALQLSYQREQQARAEAEHQRRTLQHVLAQAQQELETRVQQHTRQLTEQQALLSLILGQMPAAIATLSGPEHRYSFANAQYQQLVSQRAELGKTVAEIMPEVVEQGIINLLDQVYASGEPYLGTEITLMLAKPDRGPTQHYFNFVYQPLRDGQGQVQGILVFVLEVTEQVRTRRQADTLQAALLAVAQRQARERLELLHIFEHAPVAIALLREPAHRIDYCNTLFEELFPKAKLGLTVAEAYPDTALAVTIGQLDNVFQTGETYQQVEVRLPHLAPEAPRYVTLTCQAYREQDRIVGVAVFFSEVTAQVLAHQQREAQQAELQRIFEQAPVAIAIMRGPQLVVELANAEVSAIWGRPLGQTLGRPYFEAVPDTAGQGFEEILARVLATGEPFFITEAPVTLDRGHASLPTQAYVNFAFQPLYGEGPQPTGLIAIGTEVTTQVVARQQVQALNTELTASNRQLTRTNAELDSFVYTASHDLKAPIANVEGLLTVLRQELPAPLVATPLVARLLGLMEASISRFQQTIGQLTDVARLSQDNDETPTESVDLAALIEDVRLDLADDLAETGAQLTVEVAACPRVQFAPPHLRSIVFNLLSNALRYRALDRVPKVRLQATCAAGEFVLTVQDNGLGLTAEQQSKLFRLFKRLHTHVQGSGVGLYAIKKVVENAGGTITVQSEAGVGSTFTVVLPLKPEPLANTLIN